MSNHTATAIIAAAGSKEAAWLVYRAFWALSTQDAAQTEACSAIGAAFEAKYPK